MKFTNSLKQLTLGAVLSLTFALLIIHPGIFATAHAFPTPPDYQFEEPDSIAPDPYYVDYELNPFYAGRPFLYEELIYPTGWWWLISLGISAVLFFWNDIEDAFVGLINASHRRRFWNWMGDFGYTDKVGKTECSDLYETETRAYKRCKTDKMVELIEEFVAQANDCAKHKASMGFPPETVIGELVMDNRKSTTTSYCVFYQGPRKPHLKMKYIREVHWKWDASPWLQ